MMTQSRRRMIALTAVACCSGAGALAVGPGTFYTTANMWYEHPQKMYSTNYHAGETIKGGSKIEVTSCRKGKVTFRVEGMDEEFMYSYVIKHSSLTFEQEFSRLFTEKDQFTPVLKKAKKGIREAIEQGKIVDGMTKEQVIAAYGYPPSHVTPDPMVGDEWKYWIKRMTTKVVTFENGKVIGAAE